MKLASILQVKKILFELDIVNKKFWGENKTIKKRVEDNSLKKTAESGHLLAFFFILFCQLDSQYLH